MWLEEICVEQFGQRSTDWKKATGGTVKDEIRVLLIILFSVKGSDPLQRLELSSELFKSNLKSLSKVWLEKFVKVIGKA